MEQVRETIAESRAHTDLSLGAERASTDVDSEWAAPAARRLLDDLIERDRKRADERLWKFRDSADTVLARKRSTAPASARVGAVAVERQVADEGKKAERDDADALIERERQRADAIIEAERREHEAHRIRHQARRQDTNDQLSKERSGADVAVGALYETNSALVHAQGEQGHRSDVLGIVAHDLRSPLCVIMINAQNISTLTKEGSTREAAEEMTCAAARMERLLTDLLDVARIESGTLRIVKRQHDAGALMREVLQSYRPLFAERGITFTVKVPMGVVAASFDHDRVVQVLSNLLGNAMKFTPPKGTVDLHLEQRPEELEFVLRDSGPGIAPESLLSVFQRFCQIDSDVRRGLGLGLHICEKIINAHGGRIWVESDLGKGATFRFTLPTT